MKASHWLRRSTLAVVGLTMALAGCENASEKGLLLEPKHGEEQVLISWEGDNGYRVAAETEESVGSVEGVIGSAGGTLALGKHLLFVPAGAVDANTTFRIEKEDGDHVRLHLTASRHGNNDVGKRGFNRPVRLMLSYEGTSNVSATNVALLRVMFIREDERVEPLPSLVNHYDRWVGAELRHFSEYGIGWPNLTGPTY